MPTNLIPTFKGDVRQKAEGDYTLQGYDVNAQGAPVYVKPGYYTPGISATPVTPTPERVNPQGLTIAQMGAEAERSAREQRQAQTQAQNAQTIADIYGQATGAQSDLDRAYASQRSLLEEQMQPLDEEAIRRESINKFQNEIDALNQFYAAKKNQAMAALVPVQKSRVGTGRAIQARRGLLGSDFGSALSQNIEQGNMQESQRTAELIDAERAAQVAALMGKARSGADAEIAAKKAARESSTKELVSFLEGQKERANKAASATMSQFANLGTEPDEEQYKELARLYKTSVTALKSQYAGEVQRSQAEAEKARLGGQRTLSPGQTVIDAEGNVVYTAPMAEKDTMRTLSPGQTVIDAEGNVVYTAPKEAKPQEPLVRQIGNKIVTSFDGGKTWNIAADESKKTGGTARSGGLQTGISKANKQAIIQNLSSVVGQDQFVSPDDYTAAKADWLQAGGTATEFDTAMRGYRNPGNPYYNVGK